MSLFAIILNISSILYFWERLFSTFLILLKNAVICIYRAEWFQPKRFFCWISKEKEGTPAAAVTTTHAHAVVSQIENRGSYVHASKQEIRKEQSFSSLNLCVCYVSLAAAGLLKKAIKVKKFLSTYEGNKVSYSIESWKWGIFRQRQLFCNRKISSVVGCPAFSTGFPHSTVCSPSGRGGHFCPSTSLAAYFRAKMPTPALEFYGSWFTGGDLFHYIVRLLFPLFESLTQLKLGKKSVKWSLQLLWENCKPKKAIRNLDSCNFVSWTNNLVKNFWKYGGTFQEK